jgi:hypothetical protein
MARVGRYKLTCERARDGRRFARVIELLPDGTARLVGHSQSYRNALRAFHQGSNMALQDHIKLGGKSETFNITAGVFQ